MNTQTFAIWLFSLCPSANHITQEWAKLVVATMVACPLSIHPTCFTATPSVKQSSLRCLSSSSFFLLFTIILLQLFHTHTLPNNNSRALQQTLEPLFSHYSFFTEWTYCDVVTVVVMVLWNEAHILANSHDSNNHNNHFPGCPLSVLCAPCFLTSFHLISFFFFCSTRHFEWMVWCHTYLLFNTALPLL